MKTDKKAGVVLDNLAKLDMSQLDKVVKEIDISATKLELPDFANIVQDVVKQAMMLSQIRENVGIASGSLRTADNALAKYSTPQEGIDEDTRLDMLRLVTAKITNGKTKAQKYLDGVLSSGNLYCRQTAAVAYVRAILTQTYRSTKDAWAGFHDLENRGILVGSEAGKIVVCYKRYDLASEFKFDEDHLAKIGEAIEKFTRHLTALVAEERRVATAEMLARAKISLAMAIKGKDCKEGMLGDCLVDVPAEHYEYCLTHKQRNCTLNKGCKMETQHRGGGKILVNFTQDELIPLQVSGSCERIVNEMIELDIRLPKHTLKWDVAPGIGRQFQDVARTIAHNRKLGIEDAEYYLKGEQLLWQLVHRAITKLLAEERTAEEKEGFRSEAVIESTEFFADTNADGVAFLEVEGTFRDGEYPIPNIFLLAANHGTEVELIKVPSHLEKLFGQFVGKRFSTTNNFGTCPDILRRIFRIMANRAKRDHQIAVANAETEPVPAQASEPVTA